MSDEDFDLVTLVHLKGAYSCTKAVWPLFRQQKVSRVAIILVVANASSEGSSTLLLPPDCTETWVKPITRLRRASQIQTFSIGSR